MKSNFYEKMIKTDDKNKKLLLEKMSNLLDESINAFIEKRKRDVNENKIKFDKNNLLSKLKEDMNYIQIECNDVQRSYLRHRNERIIRIRNMIQVLEEESENLNRLFENNNSEMLG